MRAIHIPRSALWVSTCALLACRGDGDRTAEKWHPESLSDAICLPQHNCNDLWNVEPEVLLGANLGIVECTAHDSAILFGSWPIEDASTPFFEWKADVPVRAVFPSLGYVSMAFWCVPPSSRSPNVMTTLATNLGPVPVIAPGGFDWAKPALENVFIPLYGEATLDHDARATADLDEPADASRRTVTVTVAEPNTVPTAHRGLRHGDAFPWGAYRATIARIVEPEHRVLGVSGWIEVALAKAASDAGGP